MATFDLVFGILKWAGSVVGWLFNSVFSFFLSLFTLTPGAAFVLLIFVFPIIVGVFLIFLHWWKTGWDEE